MDVELDDKNKKYVIYAGDNSEKMCVNFMLNFSLTSMNVK